MSKCLRYTKFELTHNTCMLKGGSTPHVRMDNGYDKYIIKIRRVTTNSQHEI